MNSNNFENCLSVGVPSLDQQHQKLLGYIQTLQDLYIQEVNHEKVNPLDVEEVFFKLVDYTHIHFKEEEEFMQKNQYPGYLRHKQTHETLTSQLQYLKNEFDRIGMAILPKLIAFLGTWLQGHINHIDQGYAIFAKKAPDTKAG